MSVPAPLIILSSPHSFASVISAMLGQNPEAYSVPELNILVGAKLSALYDALPAPRTHGLLRTVAQLYTGEQTLESIETARRWVFQRLQRASQDVYLALCRKVAPLRLIDKSSVYTDPKRADILARLKEAFPEAYYLHLVCHPRRQCLTWLQSPLALGQLFSLGSIDRLGGQTLIDPQFDWYWRHAGIMKFLQGIPADHQLRVPSEDIMEDPWSHLQRLCAWLGFPWSETVFEAMLHPENSSYSGPGPYGAEGGNNAAFLASPRYRRPPLGERQALDGPLPWRQDGKRFIPELIDLARQFGYA
jgi:hypothetical protein